MSFADTLAEKWGTPAGAVIVLGVVIWLIQLESRSINNKAELAQQAITDATIAAKLAEVTTQLARTAALNDALFNQVQGLDNSMNRNESLIIQNRRDAHDHSENGGGGK